MNHTVLLDWPLSTCICSRHKHQLTKPKIMHVRVVKLTERVDKGFYFIFYNIQQIYLNALMLDHLVLCYFRLTAVLLFFSQGSRDYFGIAVLWSHRHVVPRLCDCWTFPGLAPLPRSPGVRPGKQPFCHHSFCRCDWLFSFSSPPFLCSSFLLNFIYSSFLYFLALFSLSVTQSSLCHIPT